jgi:hypothetical protein
METTDKKFLTEEEQKSLQEVRGMQRAIVVELGEIELISLQLQERKEAAKKYLEEAAGKEKDFSKAIFEKYGKCTINPETFELEIIEE